MRGQGPSRTASFVAFFRALADRGLTQVEGFSDPIAERLLSPLWRGALERIAPRLQSLPPERRARAMRQLELMPLRVRAIDVELERAVAVGCRQVVILGAGLDTRAYRMRGLAQAHVFEVDHPATQAYKRAQAARLYSLARELSFVAVDFERDSLARALEAAGQRADEATAWVWEGVVMYLSDAALRATLRDVAARSALGSTLIINYHEPGFAGPTSIVRRALFRVLGEPQLGLRTRDQMRVEVEAVGFAVIRDSGTADWAERFAPAVDVPGIGRVARLLVGVR